MRRTSCPAYNMHGYKLPGILALFVFFTAFAVQISGSAAELAHGMDVQECPMESLGHVRELLEGRFDELPVSQLMLTLKGAMSKSDRPKLLFQTDYEVLQRVVNLGVKAASAATSGFEGSEAGTLKVDDISVLRPAQLWVLVEEHADPDWIDVPGMTELVSIRDNFVSYFGAILCRGLFPHLVEENSDAAGASEGKSSCTLVEPLRADGSCQLHDITSQLVVIDAQHLASHAGMFSDSTEDAGQLVIARIVEDLAIHGVAVVDGLFGARFLPRVFGSWVSSTSIHSPRPEPAAWIRRRSLPPC